MKKEELKKRLEHHDITLIEVTDPKKYEEGHIKGAINIPLEKIATEANKRFDKEEKIVVYCSDYLCTSSMTAVKKLMDLGFTNVFDYEGGKNEWKESGYPIVS